MNQAVQYYLIVLDILCVPTFWPQ